MTMIRFRTFLFALLLALSLPLAAQSVPSDAHLERQIAHLLNAQPALRGIRASAEGGVITLSGQVLEPEQRKAAADIAGGISGVKQVDNEITLDPDLSVRFRSALDELQGKLVRLVVNLPLLVVAILIVAIAAWLGGFISGRMRLLKRLSRHNPYMDGLLRNIVKTLVVLGGVLIALDLLGATSLVGAVLGSAGVVGLVLGFAFKDIAENYVSGILLSIRQPFAPGDTVRIDNNEGRVVALTSRATVLITADGLNLQLPNALVFKSVLTNFTRNPRRRFDFITVVDTRSSWNDAMDIGIAAIRGVDGVLGDPSPTALIKEISNDGATMQYFGWIDQRNNDLSKTRSEAMRQVRRTLRKAGIVPPSPVQSIRLVRSEDDGIDAAAAHEIHQSRDTSADRTLDASVQDAHAAEDGHNLLDSKATE
ncbi:BON domain-containing protein [Solilutibacter silvestris]|uniref:BON domain-containing protein n=1 Tax=Solilutibacter silvestris TaxID=1645665 RepID=UPI003D3417AE